MKRKLALVTGAGGEMARLLIPALRAREVDVVSVDLIAPPDEVRDQCLESIEGSILEQAVMAELFERHHPTMVFHLAAVLSSKAELDPDLAHRVNVEGTFSLFRLCNHERVEQGRAPRFLFPSSIAVYGLPDVETKTRQGAVRETEWTVPAGMYGCNKHYCEMVGSYLSANRVTGGDAHLDFRSIRFPGLISSETLPSSGTTDYAPHMIHSAAQGKPYSCFVREDSRLPFMTMPDAVDALLQLAWADTSRLSTRVYNIRGFSASAGEIRDEVLRHFPGAAIDFEPIPGKQAIVDSWPADVDDALARRDWGLSPRHDLEAAYRDYLVPALRRQYEHSAASPPAGANPQPHR